MTKARMVSIYKETMVILEAMEREKSNPASPFYGTRANLTADVNAMLVAHLRPKLTVQSLTPPKPPPPPVPLGPPGPDRAFPHGRNGEDIVRVGREYREGTTHEVWCPARKNQPMEDVVEPWCYCSEARRK